MTGSWIQAEAAGYCPRLHNRTRPLPSLHSNSEQLTRRGSHAARGSRVAGVDPRPSSGSSGGLHAGSHPDSARRNGTWPARMRSRGYMCRGGGVGKHDRVPRAVHRTAKMVRRVGQKEGSNAKQDNGRTAIFVVCLPASVKRPAGGCLVWAAAADRVLVTCTAPPPYPPSSTLHTYSL